MFRTRPLGTTASALVLAALLATLSTGVSFAHRWMPEDWVHLESPWTQSVQVWLDQLAPEDRPATAAIQGAEEKPDELRLEEHLSLNAVVSQFHRPLGTWLVLFAGALVALLYFQHLSVGRTTLLRTQVGIVALVCIWSALAKATALWAPFHVTALPIAALPIWIVQFLERRAALVIGALAALFAASAVSFEIITLAPLLAATFGAVVSAKHGRPGVGRSILPVAVGLISTSLALFTYLTMVVFRGGAAALAPSFAALGEFQLESVPVSLLLLGPSSALVAVFLREPAMAVLGGVTRRRLQRLTDLEQPVLQKIAQEAPGTWEHSRAMANLAEAASLAVGADPLLTRVGAYYHDLGKTIQPKYFVENLDLGEPSPHDGLDPDVSADAIMAHVVQGTHMLRDAGIPEPVIEFAYTHHGTSVIEYFWHKCNEQGNPKNLPESNFRYPGMKPRSKETAILMLVDALEAGARTVDPPTRQGFNQLVQRITYTKLRQGQLDDSGLVMSDLRILMERLTETLAKVHHKRIPYPWQKQGKKGGDTFA